MSKEQNSITLPVDQLIWCVLGDDKDGLLNARIPPDLAIILSAKLQGSFKHIVVFENDNGAPYEYPILWRYSAWVTSNEALDKRRKYDEKRRITDWIRNANVDKLTDAIMKTTKMDKKQASPIAYTLIKNGNEELLKLMGLDKLITSMDEVT